jgi:hypothetical protein
MVTGEVKTQEDFFMNRPGHTFNGSEFSNLTVEGVLHAYGYGLDLLTMERVFNPFAKINKVFFHLIGGVSIFETVTINGFSLETNGSVGIDGRIESGENGVSIKSDEVDLSHGTLSSKGPIAINVKTNITIGNPLDLLRK